MKYLIYTLAFFSIINSSVQAQEELIVDYEDRREASIITNRAIKEIDLENFDIAYQLLINAINKDSTCRESYTQLYRLYSKYPQNTETNLKLMLKAKSVYSDDDEIIFYCAELYKDLNNINQAVIEYTSAINYSKINGDDFYLVPYYYLSRGNIYMKNEQYKDAIIDFSYLLKLDSNSTSGLTNRGTSYYKIGDKKNACLDWKKAMNLNFEPASKYYQKICK